MTLGKLLTHMPYINKQLNFILAERQQCPTAEKVHHRLHRLNDIPNYALHEQRQKCGWHTLCCLITSSPWLVMLSCHSRRTAWGGERAVIFHGRGEFSGGILWEFSNGLIFHGECIGELPRVGIHSSYRITSLYIQQLWFERLQLTHRYRQTRFNLLYYKLSQLS